MGAAPVPKLSVEEYLVLDRDAELKSEYHEGELFPLATATLAHSLITVNLGRRLAERLEGSECQVASTMRVKVRPAKFVYPDLLVLCGKPIFADTAAETLLNPKVIIEISSPSTAGYDYSEKFRLYKGLDSFVEYVLIAQNEPLVDVFRRQPDGDWLLSTYTGPEAQVPLKSLGVSVTIAELHAGVSYPEG